MVNGVQVGLASFRNGPICTEVVGQNPNIYVDLSFYIDWIERQIGIDFQLNLFLQRRA